MYGTDKITNHRMTTADTSIWKHDPIIHRMYGIDKITNQKVTSNDTPT